jgi:hypothetical protein
MNRKLLMTVGAVAIVTLLLVALLGTPVVGAQTPTTPTPETPAAKTPKPTLGQNFWQALADRLNVTVEQLRQAVQDAAKDTIQRALGDGRLTQEQADRLNERVDTWQGRGAPFGFFGPHGFRPKVWDRFAFKARLGQSGFEAAAKTLGMTTQDLMAELRSGKSLADLADEKKVDQATLKAAIVSAAKADIDAALANGRLTQQQADQLKSRLDQLDLDSLLGRPRFRGPGEWFGAPRRQPTPTPGGATL